MQKMSRNICFAGSLLIMAALFIGGTLMVIKSFDVGERFGSIEVSFAIPAVRFIKKCIY